MRVQGKKTVIWRVKGDNARNGDKYAEREGLEGVRKRARMRARGKKKVIWCVKGDNARNRYKYAGEKA